MRWHNEGARMFLLFVVSICVVMLPGAAAADAGGGPGSGQAPGGPDAGQAESVAVDFSADLGPATYRASGFLHGMAAKDPPQEMVEPLKPKLFRNQAEGPRGTFATYDRVKALGARSQLVVSDSYWGREWPQTDEEWKRWEEIVEQLVGKAERLGYDIEWDIWNEPEDEYFWEVDQARFFETWRRTVLKIRELDPAAIIVGPSLAGYDAKYLDEFLAYAKANSVLPDILCWHEFSWERGGHREIPAHVAETRRLLAKHEIDLERICINEIIGDSLQLSPGAAVGFFASLERAEVDGACHACWGEREEGVSNCGNCSLDGILTHPDKQPRATWWAYKGYADITGRLLSVQSSATVDGVAGYDAGAREARAVLGRVADEGPAIAVRMSFTNMGQAPGLVRDGKTHVTAQRIPVSGWEALANPVPVFDADYEVRDAQVTVTLPDFGPDDAYLITVRPPASAEGP